MKADKWYGMSARHVASNLSISAILLAVIVLVLWPKARHQESADEPGPGQEEAGGPTSTGTVRTASLFEAKGVHFRDYDEDDGHLKAEFYGDRITEMPGGQGLLEIENLHVQMYRDGKLDGVAETSRCIYNRKMRMAFSDSKLTVRQGNMVVSGIGFRWFARGQLFEIKKQTVVIVKTAEDTAMKERSKYVP